MKWSIIEDYIVGKFYLAHVETWREHLDEVMAELDEAGFDSREIGSVKMRIQNYEHLHTGKGLSNAAIQSKTVYGMFKKKSNNTMFYNDLKAYIRDTYVCSNVGSGDQESVYTNEAFSGGPQTDTNFVYTEPLGPSFQDILFDFIDERGLKDSTVYNSCMVGRDTFSHIRKGDKGVSKRTVRQLCFGLKLSYDEAVILMESAGYAFSSNNLTDAIVAYYIKNKIYDIDDANHTLYENGAELLFS
jgi:hypothetical protein